MIILLTNRLVYFGLNNARFETEGRPDSSIYRAGYIKTIEFRNLAKREQGVTEVISRPILDLVYGQDYIDLSLSVGAATKVRLFPEYITTNRVTLSFVLIAGNFYTG